MLLATSPISSEDRLRSQHTHLFSSFPAASSCSTCADSLLLYDGLLSAGLCGALVHLPDEGNVARITPDRPAHPNRHDSDVSTRMSHHNAELILLRLAQFLLGHHPFCSFCWRIRVRLLEVSSISFRVLLSMLRCLFVLVRAVSGR